MANKLIYIPKDITQNQPFCRLQLVVETFGHSTYELTNQKSSPQSYKEYENVIIKL